MEPSSCVSGLSLLLESDIYVNILNDVTMEVPLHFVTNASNSSHRGACICLEQTTWRKWIIVTGSLCCAVYEKIIR